MAIRRCIPVAALGTALLMFGACSTGGETTAGSDDTGVTASTEDASTTADATGIEADGKTEEDQPEAAKADDATEAEDATEAQTDATAESSTGPEAGAATGAATEAGIGDAGVGEVDEDRAAPEQDVTIAPTAETAEQLTMPWEILRPVEPGDDGDDVLALQQRLADLGFGPGKPDGDYGRRTEDAITAFQDLQSLPATGVADSATVVALANYSYDGLIVRVGDEGDDVEALQRRLADGPFDPGPIDGEYGTSTKQAVWALEKLAGLPVDGDWGPLDEHAWSLLQDGAIGRPEKRHDERWVEVDLSEQLAKVYDPGSDTPTLITHVSTGSGIPWKNEDYSGSSVTPKGEFHINRRISGWRESSLNIGRLYNPLYFNGGIAFHGATSVPLHPASHGCVRLPMHIAEYMPDELPNGTTVHVLT